MTATLVKDPVRLSPSMLEAAEVTEAPGTEADSQPLAYLYADWAPAPDGPVPVETGHYDPESQTWLLPPGTIVAGNWTHCKGGAGGWETVIDDACV